MTGIPIVSGDPGTGDGSGSPASFSMFVLPFTYRGEFNEDDSSTPRFVPSLLKPADPRRIYFTAETSHALFDQARHYVLDKMRLCSSGFAFYRDGRDIAVKLMAPRLVLFPGRQDPSATDPLRIGFLILTLYFTAPDGKPNYLDDLLALNELYRYCREPYPGHSEHGYKQALHRDFCGSSDIYAGRWLKWLKYAPGLQVEVPDLTACGDNRAFVWTCAILPDGSKTVREAVTAQIRPDQWPVQDYELGPWIRLLNVDRPSSSALGTEYEKEWAKQRTYSRWEHFGSLYGMHFHAGAMLGSDVEEPPLWRHFMGIYFDQTLLLLYLRVALFRFSARLSEISRRAYERQHDQSQVATAEPADLNLENNKDRWRKEFQQLRWSFALFSNVYGVPLLSNQQQGIEMYTLAREHMDVRELFEQVRQSIHDSHEYLQVEAESKQSEMTTRLTVVASVGMAVSIAAGILGMNMFTESSFKAGSGNGSEGSGLMLFAYIAVLSGIAVLIVALAYRPIERLFVRFIRPFCRVREPQ